MNLRDNKMDEFSDTKKKGFFGGQKKLKAPSQKKKIEQSSQRRLRPVKQEGLEQENQRQGENTQNIAKSIQVSKKEKWTRKKSKAQLPEEKLDYQEKIEYTKEYSRYLQDNPEDVLAHWRGPDFEHYPRSKKWYTGISIIVALIIFYAVWTDSIIMAIVFALIWLVGYLQLSRPQTVIDFAVTYEGILVGDEMYDFDEIKSFWIFYEPPHTRIISLHMKGYLRPYLHIPLHQIDPVIVHEKLVEFIPEEKQEQNLVDVLERLLHM